MTTFATTLETPEKSKDGRRAGKKKGGNQREQNKKDKSDNKDKDLSNIECFACGENGHYANGCPSRQTKATKEDNKIDTAMSHGMQARSPLTMC